MRSMTNQPTKFKSNLAAFAMLAGLGAAPLAAQTAPRAVSGIYPQLAMFNNEGECGTGAVVPWAGRLWVVTYAPHSPKGSSDKLYEITPDLQQIIRPESIGGTPANRMIHRESKQLFIGPYAIDAQRKVRVIPYTQMFGRPTGKCAPSLRSGQQNLLRHDGRRALRSGRENACRQGIMGRRSPKQVPVMPLCRAITAKALIRGRVA